MNNYLIIVFLAENPEKIAFQVISGDGDYRGWTGIVHTAPTFGADDAKVAKEAGVPPMLVRDEYDNLVPLVDLQGRFREAWRLCRYVR